MCHGIILNGCNSSFSTLILKIGNPTIVKDYKSISLIGVQYKIIAKLLANCLALVINDIVSSEQSVFVKGKQILDDTLMVNEITSWYKKKKRKVMIMKVDFDKAYDSVCWGYLLQIMEFMGFDQKWIGCINACLISSRASILVNGSPM